MALHIKFKINTISKNNGEIEINRKIVSNECIIKFKRCTILKIKINGIISSFRVHYNKFYSLIFSQYAESGFMLRRVLVKTWTNVEEVL